jgi:hypothetical protein
MAIKVPYLAALQFTDAVITLLLDGCELALYKNNYTPINTSLLANFTECNFDGYARITLTGWPAAALDANNKAATALAAQTFTCTGAVTPNDVYGMFVVSGAGALMFAERNPSGPITINTAGQTYSYTPKFTGLTEF